MMDSPYTVVITGASGGVGRAVAQAFAAQGARIALIARSAEALDTVCRDVEQAGGTPLAFPADVADAEHIAAVAEDIEHRLGAVDVWVNDAMATVFGPLWTIRPAEFRRATATTYLGAVYGTMAALACMRPRNRGHIIQIGSSLAYRGIPLQSAYCGAKHALRGFTDSLRCELIHENSAIRLTMVHLPAMNTPQFDWAENRLPNKPMPLPPIYQPEVAARAVLKAVRRPRREVWVGRSTFMTIIGNRFFPGLLDRMLARKAWEGQMRSEADPGRPGNLFATVEPLHATRGSFDREAKSSALTW